MPLLPNAPATTQERQPALQPIRDFSGGKGPHAGRCEFEREGQAVEAAADLGHRSDVVIGQHECRCGRRGALAEQGDRRHRRGGRSAARHRGGRHGQRLHGQYSFAIDAQRFAAGGQDGQIGAVPHEGVD